MRRIHLTTVINASPKKVFDIAKSVDVHILNLQYSVDKITIGRRSGLYEQGNETGWKIKSLLSDRLVQMQIIEMDSLNFFSETITKNGFREIKHLHYFKAIDNGTIMINIFEFEKTGFFAGFFEQFVHLPHFRKALEMSIEMIKRKAEIM